jgi:hypothetical protein
MADGGLTPQSAAESSAKFGSGRYSERSALGCAPSCSDTS